jgi:hypothetical protein
LIKCQSIQKSLLSYISFFFSSFVDQNKARYIDVLSESVAIKSVSLLQPKLKIQAAHDSHCHSFIACTQVSAWPDSRPDVQRMVEWTDKKLKALGVKTELADVGSQILPDGKSLKLPNVILGNLGEVSFNFFPIVTTKRT